jgi:hypothetical protein
MDLDAILRRAEALKERSNWDNVFQQIAERVLPEMAEFTSQRTEGERRTEKMFDPTPALAARKAISAISAFAWPSNQRYQKLTTNDPDLNKVHRVKAYFDEVTDRIFRARYSPRASFESQMAELALMSHVFGTGPMFVDEDIKRQTLRYKSLHLANTYVAEDASGRIDTVYLCRPWTVRQIAQRWPDSMPEKVRAKLITTPDEKIDVGFLCGPREDYESGRLGPRGLPFFGVYFLPGEKYMLEETGYSSWPFVVHRHMTTPGEVYGRSPTWLVLSSIKVLNQQKKSILQAAQKIVDPPLLAHEDGVLSAFSQVPGAVNFGALDAQGNQLVKPLITGARVDIGLDMMDREREMIADANLMDIMRVLIENPQMTATQTLELLNERAVIMAPIIGRYESEVFSPMTEREIDLLSRAGQLPKMPPELLEAAGEYKIEFTSPMRRAMRSSDAIAITRTMESVMSMAQVQPNVLDTFDMDAIVRELADINGVPAKCLRDEDAMRALKDQRAGEAEAAQLLEAAPVVSSSLKNLAQAQAAGGLQPGMVAA